MDYLKKLLQEIKAIYYLHKNIENHNYIEFIFYLLLNNLFILINFIKNFQFIVHNIKILTFHDEYFYEIYK